MANTEIDNITASIDDYLLAVADGIHQAQLQLNRMRIPAQPGQPAITYQLPRVDFELKMSFEVSRKTDEEGASGLTLRARPISAEQVSARTANAEAASILKGSFVAVPTDGGKPPSIVNTTLNQIGPRVLEIVVRVQSATGADVAGVEVQFNIDREQSHRMNRLEGNDHDLLAGTTLWEGKVPTNTSGRAVNTLRVDDNEPPNTYIVIIIDVSGETQTIVFKVEG